MITEQVKRDAIIPYEKNAKKHNEKQIKNVTESIRQFGFVQPLVIDSNNILIIGHCRLEAAKRLGLDEVPCVRLEKLSEEQINKLRILDNKLNESEWIPELLLENMEMLDFSDFELEWEGIDFEPLIEPPEAEEGSLFDDVEKIESHYGVPYQGNKSRIADIITDILPEGQRFVDLFGGGWSGHSLCSVKRQMGPLFI